MTRKSDSTIICRLRVYFLLKLVISTAVEARLKITPTNVTVRPGEDVRFNCSTESLDSVDWTYRKDESQNYRNIFIGRTGGGGDKSNSYMINNRFDVDFDIPSGQYDLIIRDVTRIDEGEYVCYDTNDQDSSASAKLIVITGESKTEFCSYDVAAAVGSEVHLNFTTTQSHSIHLEHRSVDRSYPLHVFRDGRIVNDYYVLSGRFDVKVSADVWTLVIKDVQMTDAGTFICSEDNGLGKQEVRELIVLEWKNVGNGEVCTAKNCTVRFAGKCPPLLEWRQSTAGENGGNGKIQTLRSITSRDETVVTSTRVEDGDQERSSKLLCVAVTKFTAEHINQRPCLVIQELGSCEEKATNIVLIGVIIAVTFAALAVLLILFIKNRSLICQLLVKADDVITPTRQPMRGLLTPEVVVVKEEIPATQQPLAKFGTPTISNTNVGDLRESSTRKRYLNSANKENIINNPSKKYGKNAKAKRKLPLDSSSSNCKEITDD